MKYYNSIEELENCIGNFVYFYYTNNGEKDGEIVCAWAKKITKITKDSMFFDDDEKHPIRYKDIYGTDTVIFIQNKNFNLEYKGKLEEISNAQEFARELTIAEKLLYRIILKKQEAIEKGLIKTKSKK